MSLRESGVTERLCRVVGDGALKLANCGQQCVRPSRIQEVPSSHECIAYRLGNVDLALARDGRLARRRQYGSCAQPFVDFIREPVDGRLILMNVAMNGQAFQALPALNGACGPIQMRRDFLPRIEATRLGLRQT